MSLAEHLANTFACEGIISDEERDIVQYGLESMGGNLLGAVMTILIGICFKHVGDALLLCLFLFPLRKYAGGFHADTKVRCWIVSMIMLGISFALFTAFDHSMAFWGICAAMFGCIVWVLAPTDNSSKKLDMAELKVYRRRSRVILGMESVVLTLALCMGWKSIIRSICMTFFIVSMSLLMGRIKNVLLSKEEVSRQGYKECIGNR